MFERSTSGHITTAVDRTFDRERLLLLSGLPPLCLPARGCAATSIGHSKTTNRRFLPVTTMNQQPNIVQVRNGSPRSRSRSVSRSRSRSASPSAEREPRGNPYDMPDKSPTNGEEVAAKMGLRHLEKCGVAPYVAGDIDYSDFKKKPWSDTEPALRENSTGAFTAWLTVRGGELLTKLMKQLEETRGDSVEEPLTATLSLSNLSYLTTEQLELLDNDQSSMRYITIDLNVPAAETGPETMPAPHLLNIVLAVLASRDGQHGGEGGHGYADDEQEKYLRDLEAYTEAYVRKAQQRIRELERYPIASVQGTPFPHQENAPATLNDPAAAAPAPAAAKVATKVRPFITPINPDKYDVRL